MRILHLSDRKTNIRAERAGALIKAQGETNIFMAGVFEKYRFGKNIFKKTKKITISNFDQLMMKTKQYEKEIWDFINEVDPDIIHAHNIFAAMVARKIGLPMVYDDQELWSIKIKLYKRKGLKSKLGQLLQIVKYKSWEKLLAETTVAIVPSKGIQQFYKEKYKNTSTIYFPNMPLLEEVKKIRIGEKKGTDLVTVIIEGRSNSSDKHRNMKGFIEAWKKNADENKLLFIGNNELQSSKNITSTGYLSHLDCYKEAATAHVGLIPFRPYPKYDRFVAPNKAFMYIHAGLALVTAKSQTEFHDVIKEIGAGYQFVDYNDLFSFLKKNKEELLNIDSKKISAIAMRKYVLDNYADDLMDAYKLAIEKHNRLKS